MTRKLRISMTVAVTTVGLLTASVLVAQPKRAPTRLAAADQTKPASMGKADGSYPIVVGQNAIEVNDDTMRKAAFAEAEAGPPQAGYKVLTVTLPTRVNDQLGIVGTNIVVLPSGAENPHFDVLKNSMTLSWDESPDGDGDTDTPSGIELKKAACAKGYVLNGHWCTSHERTWSYSNNTAWFRGYNQYRYWYHDHDKAHNYWAIKREGTCKSKGVWTMAFCGLGSKKRTDIYQKIVSFSPKQDTKLDNCRSVSLSVDVGGVGVGGDYEACDRLDINFPNRTQFSNYWRGSSWRSERSVAYQYIVETKQGQRPRFTLWTPYCAGGVAVCPPTW